LQEDPEISFTDEDYRRRKAHPNFMDHINAEKLIVKLGKTVCEELFFVKIVCLVFLLRALS